MKTWTLGIADLQHLLRDARLEPQPASPLSEVGRPVGSARLAAIEARADLIEGLDRLARPDVTIGVVGHVPGRDPQYAWFYGVTDDRAYARHEPLEDGAHRISWPVDAFLVLEALLEPLAMDRPVEDEGVSLVVDWSGFEAVAAIADWLQEVNLLNLLQRRPPRQEAFVEGELLESCGRSRSSDDHRWTIPRARLASPIALSFSDDRIRRGIRSLVDGGLLVEGGGRFTPTPALGLVCSRLAAISGLSALSARSGSTLDHVAAFRVAGDGLWTAEFADVTADGFTVRVASVEQAVLYSRLRAGLRLPPAVPRMPPPQRAPASPRETAASRGAAGTGESVRQPRAYCSSCGRELRPAAAFCAACGYRLAPRA